MSLKELAKSCQKLHTSDKTAPLVGADVAEGIKCLLRAVLFHFNFIVLASPSGAGILTAANVQTGFASMDAEGEELPTVFQTAIGSCKGEQAKKLLRNLSLSAEKMF